MALVHWMPTLLTATYFLSRSSNSDTPSDACTRTQLERLRRTAENGAGLAHGRIKAVLMAPAIRASEDYQTVTGPISSMLL